jgi:hypothetical protein
MKKLIVLMISAAFFIAVIGGCNKREEFPVPQKPTKTYTGGNTSGTPDKSIKKQQTTQVKPQKQPPDGPMKKKKKSKKFKLKKPQ